MLVKVISRISCQSLWLPPSESQMSPSPQAVASDTLSCCAGLPDADSIISIMPLSENGYLVKANVMTALKRYEEAESILKMGQAKATDCSREYLEELQAVVFLCMCLNMCRPPVTLCCQVGQLACRQGHAEKGRTPSRECPVTMTS